MDKVENKNIPTHVGLIMDGMRQAPDWFFSRGVKIFSVFAFSTENWNRSQEEVNYLMKLLKKAIDEELEEMNKKGYKILISGKIDELPGDLPESCSEAINKTKNNQKGILNICLNYGGRAEIVEAVRKMIKKKVKVEQVHEGLIKKYLYNGELPDPDIIVRTSGEERLSGFQLWQSAYSELFFMEKYWPEFEESDVDLILEEYANRKRRFGGDGE